MFVLILWHKLQNGSNLPKLAPTQSSPFLGIPIFSVMAPAPLANLHYTVAERDILATEKVGTFPISARPINDQSNALAAV